MERGDYDISDLLSPSLFLTFILFSFSHTKVILRLVSLISRLRAPADVYVICVCVMCVRVVLGG